MEDLGRRWRILYKSVIFVFYILSYILVSLFWRLKTRDPIVRRHHYVKTVSFFSKLALWLMRFKVTVKGGVHDDKSYLVVGNHLGMLDVLVLSANHPTLFITSVEMRETPGLGLLAEMGGCLYVERRDRSNIQNEIGEIREALQQDFSVTLYPEGTSTNGERVLPFKKTLMTSAAGTGVAIMPVVLNYRKVNGEPMSDKWRDCVCWYGDQTFIPAMMRVFSMRSIEVDIEFCDEIDIEHEDQRKEIAAQVQKIIVSKYTKIPQPPGVPTYYPNIPEN